MCPHARVPDLSMAEKASRAIVFCAVIWLCCCVHLVRSFWPVLTARSLPLWLSTTRPLIMNKPTWPSRRLESTAGSTRPSRYLLAAVSGPPTPSGADCDPAFPLVEATISGVHAAFLAGTLNCSQLVAVRTFSTEGKPSRRLLSQLSCWMSLADRASACGCRHTQTGLRRLTRNSLPALSTVRTACHARRMHHEPAYYGLGRRTRVRKVCSYIEQCAGCCRCARRESSRTLNSPADGLGASARSGLRGSADAIVLRACPGQGGIVSRYPTCPPAVFALPLQTSSTALCPDGCHGTSSDCVSSSADPKPCCVRQEPLAALVCAAGQFRYP